jgi:NADH-quinone oxidoreductase subunit M
LFGIEGVTIGVESTALSALFGLLIGGGWFMVSIVSFGSRAKSATLWWLPLLSASLFLIVYARDYLLFFVGWEVMSIVTYFILSSTLSKEALIKYIIFAMASALSLLMAIVIIYSKSQSLLYIDANHGFVLLSSQMQIVVTLLMLFGFFVKLGSIGVHYWLVDSYELSDDLFTPYLSAILSKMGLYGLIIFLFYSVDISSIDSKAIGYILASVGLISSIVATFKAIKEEKIKRLLAYSSIAQLGYIVTILSIPDGVGGALYHAIVHTLLKLLLFINIASIIATTSRDRFSQLGGLIYRMPHSFVMLLIGIIVLAGMPPLGGFASKYLIYTTLLDAKSLLVLSAMMFATVSSFLYVYKLIYGIYLGHPTHKSLESVKEVSIWYLLPQYILSLLLITIGAFPAMVVPILNSILLELRLESIPFESSTTLQSAIGSFNGLVVMGAFISVFALIWLFISRVNSKVKESKDRFDIAYCGEEPTISTPLHYGYGMSRELERVGFIKIIWQNTTSIFYDKLASTTMATSSAVRKIYSGNLAINFHWLIAFGTTLLWWGL